MVEPQSMPVELTAPARWVLYHSRDLPAEQKELLAGCLRIRAREQRRLTEIREDLDVLADAAHTPYTKAEAA